MDSKLGPDDSNAMYLPSSGKLDLPADKADIKICQPVASKLGPDDFNAFMSIGFSHHMAIIRACKSLEKRLFYIRNAASGFWSYRSLLQHRMCRPASRLRQEEWPTAGHRREPVSS